MIKKYEKVHFNIYLLKFTQLIHFAISKNNNIYYRKTTYRGKMQPIEY